MPPTALSHSIAPDSSTTPKKRRFFSSAKLPPLPLARPSTPPRQGSIATDRVLAALKTDEKTVSAAKTFVKEKLGDDKWDVVDNTRLTRGAAEAEAIANGKPVTKRHAAKTSAAVRKNVPASKALAKRLSVGRPKTSIAQRIKAKGATLSRKVTLRSHVAPPPPRPAQPREPSPATIVGPSRSRQTTQPTLEVHALESPKDEETRSKDPNPGNRKEFLESGLYCQDATPSEDRMLVNRILDFRAQQPKKRGRPSLKAKAQAHLAPIPTPEGEPVSFPPLPLEFHYNVFFGGEDREFQLPFNIVWESETGALDGKKRPPFYQKVRTNQFVERAKYKYGTGPGERERAICHCDPEFGCGENCINVVMSYLCGGDCPCGENCGNKSLARRKGPATKVGWTGARGFGLFAAEDIKEGEFVIDYRGEVIHINTFIERLGTVYKGRKNFYALAYDRDEVIDAGLRGNDTRFINHGCKPNLEVRKYATLGDGYEEYEVGMWATREIKAGEELFYNYNFDSFAVTVNSREEGRQQCLCGAPNCVGFLGRKQGEKSAKELAADLGAKAAPKGLGKRGTKRASTGTPISVSTPSEETPQPQPHLETHAQATSRLPSQAVKRALSQLPRRVSEPARTRPFGAWPSWVPAGSSSAAAGPNKVNAESSLAEPPLAEPTLEATPPRAVRKVKLTLNTSPVALVEPVVATRPVTALSNGNTPTDTSSPDTPLKRGRGRPPKPRASPDAPRRPRGRPRIHPLPDPNGPPRRPRGRPRKHPLHRDVHGEMDEDEDEDSSVPPEEVGLSEEPQAPLPTAVPVVPIPTALLEAEDLDVAATLKLRRRGGRPPKSPRPAPYTVPQRGAGSPPDAMGIVRSEVHVSQAEVSSTITGATAIHQFTIAKPRARPSSNALTAPLLMADAGAASNHIAHAATLQPQDLSVAAPPEKLKRKPGRPPKHKYDRAAQLAKVTSTIGQKVGIKPGQHAPANGTDAAVAAMVPALAVSGSPTFPTSAPALSAIPAATALPAEPPKPKRLTPKQAEKARRNGAPAGWAYVLVPSVDPTLAPAPASPHLTRPAEPAAPVVNALVPTAPVDAAGTPETPKRITPKQAEKARRNGAPAGWAFVTAVPGAPAAVEGEDLKPSARAARLARRSLG